MKKAMSLILAILLSLSFCACTAVSPNSSNETANKPTSPPPTMPPLPEMNLSEAIDSFTSDDGKDYFEKHMADYATVDAADAVASFGSKIWMIRYSEVLNGSISSSWYGGFTFEADGRIKEFIDKVGYGYINNRTWDIEDNKLVLDISGKPNMRRVCEIRSVDQNVYLLVMDNRPYAILYLP